MKNFTLVWITIISAAGLFNYSCNSVNQQANAEEIKEDSSQLKDVSAMEVGVMVAKVSDFENEIVSNGKAVASNKADLYFNQREVIRLINFRNGDKVKKGDTIAILDNFTLKIRMDQAKLAYERAELNFYDLLIGQGYDYHDLSAIPEDILKKAKIKTGYTGALNDLELAQFQYQESFLKSPINGVIANLYDKANNYPTSNQPFCTILNNQRFDVTFQVMESEIHKVNAGEKVLIRPYFNESNSLTGWVGQVNPVVDKNGLVNLTALVDNVNNVLYEGMNVKVFLKSPVKNKITVPKEAVTIRSDKPVVFTLKDGVANWVYVTTGAENSSSIVIEDGIFEHDTVIYKGTLHLAHGTDVVVVE